MTKNYYEVLGVSSSARITEIKNAYIVKIRQFSAEIHPTEFQQIQEAYEVLGNEERRLQYDIEITYGDEIERLSALALEAMEDQDFEAANTYLARLLAINPKDTAVLNRFGLNSIRTKDYYQAIDLFKQAIAINEENATYHFNLATVYESVGQQDFALRSYKQALLRAPNDFEVIENIAILYLKLDQFDNAWLTVERTLKRQKDPHEQAHFLFIKLLMEIAAVHNADFEMKIALRYAEKFIHEFIGNQEEYVQEFCKVGLRLADNKRFSAAQRIVNWVVLMDDCAEYRQLQNEIQEDVRLYDEFEVLSEDESIIQSISLKVYLYLYSDEVEDFEERLEMVHDMAIKDCENTPEFILSSIRKMMRDYPTIYQRIKSWIDTIESYARGR